MVGRHRRAVPDECDATAHGGIGEGDHGAALARIGAPSDVRRTGNGERVEPVTGQNYRVFGGDLTVPETPDDQPGRAETGAGGGEGYVDVPTAVRLDAAGIGARYSKVTRVLPCRINSDTDEIPE